MPQQMPVRTRKHVGFFLHFLVAFYFFRLRVVLSIWPTCLKKRNSLSPAFPICLILQVTETFGMAPTPNRFSFKIEKSNSQGPLAHKVSNHSSWRVVTCALNRVFIAITTSWEGKNQQSLYLIENEIA